MLELLSSPEYKLANDEPLEAYYNESVEDAVPLFSRPLAKYLKVKERVVEQSLMAMLKDVKDGCPAREDYRKAFWRMAALHETMKSGSPVEPFYGFPMPEWTPVSVIDFMPDFRTRTRINGYTYTFLCLGGTAATVEFNKFFSHEQMYWLKRELFKLARFTKERPNREDYVGMRGWVMLSGEAGRINFDRVGNTSSFETHNRRLLTDRKKECPIDLPLPCRGCYVGLDNCHRAVHYHTYELRECPICHKLDAWFVPYKSAPMCLHCKHKRRIGRLKGKEANVK